LLTAGGTGGGSGGGEGGGAGGGTTGKGPRPQRGKSFKEHSGKIRGSFSEKNKIQKKKGAFREHSEHIWGTVREHSRNSQRTFRDHSGNIQGAVAAAKEGARVAARYAKRPGHSAVN
jgi:gas vesicle protein